MTAQIVQSLVRTTRTRFSGVYETFDAAEKAAPRTKPVGHNTPAAPNMYVYAIGSLVPSDYPVMFWAAQFISATKMVLDIGGNIGISFYAYRSRLPFPDDLRWLVYDVPEVANGGEELAATKFRESSTGLHFARSLEEARACDFLLASGSLQYIDEPLDALLDRIQARPEHIIINRTPVLEGEPFITLQDNEELYSPYKVFNRAEFIDPLLKLGYELVDSWIVHELACYVRFRPDKVVPHYSGFYLRQRG